MEPLLLYRSRLDALRADALRLESTQSTALFTAVSAAAGTLILAFLALTQKTYPWWVAVLPAGLALYSLSRRKRLTTELFQSLRLKSYYERGINRLEGEWAGTGPGGEEFTVPGHPYDHDLQVFGDGSLFELLCICRTEVGRRKLADFLLTTPQPDETLARQEAVKELQSRTDLREQINLLGDFSFEQSSWERIVTWLESPRTPVSAGMRLFALAGSLTVCVLIGLGLSLVVKWSDLQVLIAGALALNAAIGQMYRTQLSAALPAIRAVGSELAVLRQGLELLGNQRFTSARLRALVDEASEGNPPARVRQLQRLIGAMNDRDKEWFYLPSRLLLIGTQLFLSIEKWRAQNGGPMRRWLEVWGEFEALMALANYAHEHPENKFPALAMETCFEATSLGHPLIAAATCVRNDISLNRATRFYVVSGSNMAGKSTLIRSIGLNAVLGWAGAPVCATTLTLSRFFLCASLSVQDSLLTGKSKFLAEMDRIRQALEVPVEDGPVLFLVDEILSGTNSKDRRIATEAIVRALLDRGAIGVLSTHDLALTELGTVPELAGANVHMGSRNDSDPMDFDYVLKPGATTQSSALAIARLAGVPV